MRLQDAGVDARRILTFLLLSMAVLLVASSALTQDSPVMQGLAVAREIVEEERGEPLRLVRWRFYEDNWSSEASVRLYGAFGIDSCASGIPFARKRATILFGWTYSLLDASGKEYQARVSYDLAQSVICDEVRIPPQYAPEPTPVPPPAPAPEAAAETAAQPAESQTVAVAPIASTANVGGFALGGHVAGFDGGAINAMRQAGMTWVKKQVTHGISDGAGIIPAAHGQGFKVLLGALGSKDRLRDNFEGYVAEFAQYVAHLAGQGADAIEVWNEPNIQHEWPSGQINGASYTRLLQAAYQAIKAANPATIVVSGAPAPTGFSGTGCEAGGCNDNVFVAQMAQAGAANYMDCVGVHYNAGAVPPNATSGAPVGSSGHYSWYLPSMMQVYRSAFPSKPLCFTELGYLTGDGLGGLPSRFAWASGNTLAEQAAWLADAVNVARGSGYVNMLIVWNVNFTAWGGDPQAGYAIIRPGGACPACGALRAAMGG
ncbi:MAG: hypothetical protein OXG53_03105 [Chloroflexi bacterium]|nr:hypothetical protein [Chloroflexota bacterium]